VRLHLSRLDALLVLMTVIWGGNYSVIKAALREIPPIAFNALRLTLASLLFLVAIGVGSRLQFLRTAIHRHPQVSRMQKLQTTPDTLRGDWAGIVLLALVGQFIYQLLFMAALARTSVANSSLILGCTPIFVALMTAALGHERITPLRWAAAALSAFGIYLVVGHGAAVSRASLGGDLMMLAAVLCWSAATVGSRPLLARHSPLVVTGYSMAIGSALYVPFAWVALRDLAWRYVSASAWLSVVFSAVFALCVAYMIWYTAVQRLGNTRTSVYSNMVPLVAMVVAWGWLGEHIGAMKIAGAGAIILGVALTKIQETDAPVAEPA
jgi:drug/metabolite transporter (DMT)-like permease